MKTLIAQYVEKSVRKQLPLCCCCRAREWALPPASWKYLSKGQMPVHSSPHSSNSVSLSTRRTCPCVRRRAYKSMYSPIGTIRKDPKLQKCLLRKRLNPVSGLEHRFCAPRPPLPPLPLLLLFSARFSLFGDSSDYREGGSSNV